jgi:hypothetical protein
MRLTRPRTAAAVTRPARAASHQMRCLVLILAVISVIGATPVVRATPVSLSDNEVLALMDDMVSEAASFIETMKARGRDEVQRLTSVHDIALSFGDGTVWGSENAKHIAFAGPYSSAAGAGVDHGFEWGPPTVEDMQTAREALAEALARSGADALTPGQRGVAIRAALEAQSERLWQVQADAIETHADGLRLLYHMASGIDGRQNRALLDFQDQAWELSRDERERATAAFQERMRSERLAIERALAQESIALANERNGLLIELRRDVAARRDALARQVGGWGDLPDQDAAFDGWMAQNYHGWASPILRVASESDINLRAAEHGMRATYEEVVSIDDAFGFPPPHSEPGAGGGHYVLIPTPIFEAGSAEPDIELDPAAYPVRVRLPLTQVFDIHAFGPGISDVPNPWHGPLQLDEDGVPRSIGSLFPPRILEALVANDVVLVIRGRNLFGRNGAAPVLATDQSELLDEHGRPVAYRPIAISTLRTGEDRRAEDPLRHFWALHERRLEQPGMPDKVRSLMDGDQLLVVALALPLGQRPDTHEVSIRGTKAHWFHPGNITASVEFVRALGDDETIPIDRLLIHDRFQVEIRLSHPLPRAGSEPADDADTDERQLEFALTVDGDLLLPPGGQPWVASVDPNDPTLYRSAPFHLAAEDGSSRTRSCEQPIQLGFQSHVTARLVAGSPVHQSRIPLAIVRRTPADDAALWRQAVLDAARATGQDLGTSLETVSRERLDDIVIAPLLHLPGGGERTRVEVGDLAAAYLLANTFLQEMDALRLQVLRIIDDSELEPGLALAMLETLRPVAANPDSPLGRLSDRMELPRPPAGALRWSDGIMLPFEDFATRETVRFADLYDENWLSERSTPEMRGEVLSFATRRLLRVYADRIQGVIDSFAALDPDDAEAWLTMTGLGFDPIVRLTLGRMMELDDEQYRDPATGQVRNGFVWTFNRVARARVRGVSTLAAKLRADRDVANITTDIEVCVMTLPAIGGPSTVGYRLFTASVAMTGLYGELSLKLPDYLFRDQQAEMAAIAVPVLGADAFSLADARRIPKWAQALALAGNVLGVGAEFTQLVQTVQVSRTIARFEELVEFVEARGPVALAELDAEEVARSVAVMGRGYLVREAGVAMSDLDRAAARAADRFLDAMSASQPAAPLVIVRPGRAVQYFDPAEATWVMSRNQAALDAFDPFAPDLMAEPLIHTDEATAVFDPVHFAELVDGSETTLAYQQVLQLPGEADAIPEGTHLFETFVAPRAGEATEVFEPFTPPGDLQQLLETTGIFQIDLPPPPMRVRLVPLPETVLGIAPATRSHPARAFAPFFRWNLDERIGTGAFAEVYAVAGDENIVLKAYDAFRIIDEKHRGSEAARRAIVLSELLSEEGIPHLRTIAGSDAPTAPFTIQQRAPAGSLIEGEVVTETVTVPAYGGGRAVDYDIARGLTDFGGSQMSRDHALAICRLYKKLADQNLIWTDGHIRNVCFIEAPDGELVGHILDIDHVWQFDQRIAENINALEALPLQMKYLGPLNDSIGSPIFSARGIGKEEAVIQRSIQGLHPWYDAETTMMKMLEHWGYIHFDPVSCRFTDGMMKVDHVREVFAGLDDAVTDAARRGLR